MIDYFLFLLVFYLYHMNFFPVTRFLITPLLVLEAPTDKTSSNIIGKCMLLKLELEDEMDVEILQKILMWITEPRDEFLTLKATEGPSKLNLCQFVKETSIFNVVKGENRSPRRKTLGVKSGIRLRVIEQKVRGMIYYACMSGLQR